MESQAKTEGQARRFGTLGFGASQRTRLQTPVCSAIAAQRASGPIRQRDISPARNLRFRCGFSRRWAARSLVQLLLVTASFIPSPAADPAVNQSTNTEVRVFARSRAEEAHEAARKAAVATNSVENLWQVGRTAFDLAETLTREKLKAQVAESGINACQAAIAQNPASAPAHYYLALCLGQLAQTKSIGALRLVREMEEKFKRVRTLDESFDYAGADRGLGLLYLEAPGWPTSIGDRKKARTHLERAIVLAPKYPDNRINLLDLLVRLRDVRAATAELSNLEAIWSEAKQQLTGPEWVEAWSDWESRKKRLEEKIPKLNRK